MALADLQRYATEQKKLMKRRCATCELPPDVLATLRKGRSVHRYSFRILSGFLRTVGHEIQPTTLQKHWEAHEQS